MDAISDDVHIRWLTRRDIPHAALIDKRSCDDNANWTEDRIRSMSISRSNIGRVVEMPYDGIIGYSCVSMFREDQIDAEIQENEFAEYVFIHRLVVDKEYRRRGYASLMMDRIELNQRSFRRGFVCMVHEESLSTQLFLSQRGYIGKCKRYLGENVIQMTKET
jgi:GNAT superfamily N-acetyltransferase